MSFLRPLCAAFALLPGPALAAVIVQNVTVVDTVTGTHAPGMTVVIEGDTITAVGTATPGPGDTVIDGTGLYAIPGLNDMHTHALTSGEAEVNLRLMLAMGITGYRQMGGLPGPAPARTGPGPDLLALPGDILTDGNVRSPDQVAEAIRRQKEAGADFIKILVDNPAVYVAALDAAEAEGMPIAGHFPPTISAETAAEHGMDAMEHLGPRETLLLSASNREEELRRQIAETPPPPPPSAPPPPEFYARVIANPIPFTSPAQFERMFAMADSYEEGKARTLAGVLREAGVWQVPTLIRLHTMNHGDDPLYRDDPNLAYVTGAQRALWNGIANGYAGAIPEGAKEALDRLYETQLRLTKLFADEGVPMLAGSDYGGQWLVAGFSLHQEFDELARAGLTPLQILQMATLNAGLFLGQEDRIGRIAPGMAADIVLLDADPLADVANLRRSVGVIDSGHPHDRAALDAMLAQ